jgi:hypothetical protein
LFNSDKPCLSCDSQVRPEASGCFLLEARILLPDNCNAYVISSRMQTAMSYEHLSAPFPRLGPSMRTRTRNERERGGALRFRFFHIFWSRLRPDFPFGPVLGYTTQITLPSVHTYKNTHAPSNENTHIHRTRTRSSFFFLPFLSRNFWPSDHNPAGFSILAPFNL